jgi:hypothetical protein
MRIRCRGLVFTALLPSSASICLFHYSGFFRHVTCSLLQAARLVPRFPWGLACSVCWVLANGTSTSCWPQRFWFRFRGGRTSGSGWWSPTMPARKLLTMSSFAWKGSGPPQCPLSRFPGPGDKTWLLAFRLPASRSAWGPRCLPLTSSCRFYFILLCLRWMPCMIPYSWP